VCNVVCHCYPLQVGMVCNNAHVRDNKPIGHPTEAAILGVGLKAGLQGLSEQFIRSEERAFSSEHKWMAVRARLRSSNKFEVSPYLCCVVAASCCYINNTI